jgi:hypothetical protein
MDICFPDHGTIWQAEASAWVGADRIATEDAQFWGGSPVIGRLYACEIGVGGASDGIEVGV